MDAPSVIGWLEETRTILHEYPVIAKTVYSLIVAVITYLILRLYYSILKRLAGIRALEPDAVERLYRFTSLAAWTIALSIIVYIITGATAAWATALMIIAVIIAANAENIVNMFSYYAILAQRLVRPGDFIEVEGLASGRVREVRYLHTVIEGDGGVYFIPNRELIRRGFRVMDEITPARILVTVKGLRGPEEVEEVRRKIESVAEMRSGEIAAIRHPLHGPTGARAYVRGLSSDKAEYLVELHIPRPTAGPRRLGSLLYPIAAALQEAGYEFEIKLEPTST
jgi:small-conductance mechanosensitive channel